MSVQYVRKYLVSALFGPIRPDPDQTVFISCISKKERTHLVMILISDGINLKYRIDVVRDELDIGQHIHQHDAMLECPQD